MSRDFEELDYRETPLGELILRRRRMLSLGGMEIYEVKLGDAFLMSSLFHEVEMALAHLGLSELEGESWDVVVGGLGLGYTAVAALEHREVASLLIVDALLPVIEWHQRGLRPTWRKADERSALPMLHADFFACARSAEGFDPGTSRADCFTRCCWISIIRRGVCCTRATPSSIKRMGCALSARICIPAGSSPFGRTIRRMKISSARSTTLSRRPARISSLFLIRCWNDIRRARCMSRAKLVADRDRVRQVVMNRRFLGQRWQARIGT